MCFCGEIHLQHPGLNGQGFLKHRKSKTEQGPRFPCFLLPCSANTIRGMLWVNQKGSGVSSQVWGQLTFANLTLGKLLVLVFLKLTEL